MANKKPLEWSGKSRTIIATDASPVNEKINLALRDDEVAEIHKIEVMVELTMAAASTGGRVDYALSMDPDINDSPTHDNTWEDLEVFHGSSVIKNVLQLAADIDETDRGDDYKSLDYNPPILVGTNVGITSKATWLVADGEAGLRVKVFFTRRKATVQELNQILLKRR